MFVIKRVIIIIKVDAQDMWVEEGSDLSREGAVGGPGHNPAHKGTRADLNISRLQMSEQGRFGVQEVRSGMWEWMINVRQVLADRTHSKTTQGDKYYSNATET